MAAAASAVGHDRARSLSRNRLRTMRGLAVDAPERARTPCPWVAPERAQGPTNRPDADRAVGTVRGPRPPVAAPPRSRREPARVAGRGVGIGIGRERAIADGPVVAGRSGSIPRRPGRWPRASATIAAVRLRERPERRPRRIPDPDADRTCPWNRRRSILIHQSVNATKTPVADDVNSFLFLTQSSSSFWREPPASLPGERKRLDKLVIAAVSQKGSTRPAPIEDRSSPIDVDREPHAPHGFGRPSFDSKAGRRPGSGRRAAGPPGPAQGVLKGKPGERSTRNPPPFTIIYDAFGKH
jgi:hypothetical protein